MNVEDSAITRIALEMWAEIGRISRLPTQGFSMWPVLRSGECLSVRHGGARPEVGQVIVFLDGERTVAHRVIRRRESGKQTLYQTKGDTCLAVDPRWVAVDRIVGVVEGVVAGEEIIKRLGTEGRWGLCLAILSRLQGLLCAPLRLMATRLKGGPTRR